MRRNQCYDGRPTLCDRLLIAAKALDKDEFTKQELCVEAWRNSPSAFGLAGFEGEHPDFHKVVGALSGVRGGVATGLFRPVGDKLKIGEAGYERLKPKEEPVPKPTVVNVDGIKLASSELEEIVRLHTKSQVIYQRGIPNTTYLDLFSFLGVSSRPKMKAYKLALDRFQSICLKLSALHEADCDVVLCSIDGQKINFGEMKAVRNLGEHLLYHYGNHNLLCTHIDQGV